MAMTADEIREQARSIYKKDQPLDNRVTDLIYTLVMALAEVIERLDRMIHTHDKEDAN